jgi:hypothetical protein
MSFGYSVGDFIAGANLTYRLIRALSASQGASIEYQEAMVELGAIQQAFLQVSQMRASSILSQATINAASHIIISSLEIIGRFLDKSQKYQRRLSGGDSWCKIGWALFKKDELKGLRDSLHVKLSAVNLLLSSARLCVFLALLPAYYCGNIALADESCCASALATDRRQVVWHNTKSIQDLGVLIPGTLMFRTQSLFRPRILLFKKSSSLPQIRASSSLAIIL